MQYCPRLHFQFATQLDCQLSLFLKSIQRFQDQQTMFLGRFQYDKKLFLCYFRSKFVAIQNRLLRSFRKKTKIKLAWSVAVLKKCGHTNQINLSVIWFFSIIRDEIWKCFFSDWWKSILLGLESRLWALELLSWSRILYHVTISLKSVPDWVTVGDVVLWMLGRGKPLVVGGGVW